MASIKPLVYGYLCVEEPDENEIARLRKDMGKFCSANNYRLSSVFVDRGVPDVVFARTEFTRLLDAARETGAYGVAVPTLNHLSSDAFVQDALVRMVELTGATILVVCDLNGPDSQPDRSGDGHKAGYVVTVQTRREPPGGLAAAALVDDDPPVPQIGPEDRALIEHTRKVNKTLSMFVFAVQEQSSMPAAVHLDIADLLVTLADTIRERAGQQDAAPASGPAAVGAGNSSLLALEPSRETDTGL
jgi:hypothetical protein